MRKTGIALLMLGLVLVGFGVRSVTNQDINVDDSLSQAGKYALYACVPIIVLGLILLRTAAHRGKIQ